MIPMLASLTWDPGFRGIIVVAIFVLVLCGTPLVLLMTNLGGRLGFHVLITAIFGWLTLMFFLWAIYGLGYMGPTPTWKVLDASTVPASAFNTQLHNVPQPSDLPDPIGIAKSNSTVAATLKGRKTLPTLSEVVGADPTVAKKLKPKLNGWRLDAASNPVAAEASTTAGEYLEKNGFDGMQFQATTNFLVGSTFDKGGKPARTDDSMMGRVTHRIHTIAMSVIGDNPTHYAVVQIQPAINQTSLPGEPPPLPVADPSQPVINVLMVRDLGAVRQPGFAFGILSLIIFAILASSLHRRDKAGMAARAAKAAADASEA